MLRMMVDDEQCWTVGVFCLMLWDEQPIPAGDSTVLLSLITDRSILISSEARWRMPKCNQVHICHISTRTGMETAAVSPKAMGHDQTSRSTYNDDRTHGYLMGYDLQWFATEPGGPTRIHMNHAILRNLKTAEPHLEGDAATAPHALATEHSPRCHGHWKSVEARRQRVGISKGWELHHASN